jgi:hypothetical protein
VSFSRQDSRDLVIIVARCGQLANALLHLRHRAEGLLMS